MAKPKYYTVQVVPRTTISGGFSGARTAAFARAFAAMAGAANAWAVSWRIDKEVEKAIDNLDPRVVRKVPEGGGVLFWVAVIEWGVPDATGNKARHFMSISVAGVGTDPLSVHKREMSKQYFVQSPPDGWVRREVFIWAQIETEARPRPPSLSTTTSSSYRAGMTAGVAAGSEALLPDLLQELLLE